MEDALVDARTLPPGEPALERDGPVDALVRALAELVGTFTFVFVGVGATISVGITAEDGLLVSALAHGLALGVMATAVRHISGGHLNPAVTIGFLVTRRIAPLTAGLYVAAQLAAAAGAALMIRWLWPGTSAEGAGYGSPAVDPGLTTGEALVLEALITFFLVWVAFSAAADIRWASRAVAGFAVGFVYAAGILVAGPLTGAMANPARAFGPQLVDGSWDDFWLWYAGPILGGAIAALLYELLYLRPLRPAAHEVPVVPAPPDPPPLTESAGPAMDEPAPAHPPAADEPPPPPTPPS